MICGWTGGGGATAWFLQSSSLVTMLYFTNISSVPSTGYVPAPPPTLQSQGNSYCSQIKVYLQYNTMVPHKIACQHQDHQPFRPPIHTPRTQKYFRFAELLVSGVHPSLLSHELSANNDEGFWRSIE